MSPPPIPGPFSRRRALLGVAKLSGALTLAGTLTGALAGCTSDAAAPEPAPVDPDVLSTAAALAAEEQQLLLIDAVIVSFPGLSRILSATRAIHEEHRALLATADLPAPTPDPSGDSSGTPADQSVDPSASASPTPTGTPVVPATRKAALSAVVAGESALRKQHTTAALAAMDGPLARLLAQLAAAAAQQSVLLRGAS